MPLGLYISVPFCRTKCSYCNFASDVFSRAVFERYVERVTADINRAAETAAQMGGRLESSVDSIFVGGGTPTILDINQLERLFVTISQNFVLQAGAEITVECAPGTLSTAMIGALQRCGVNRVSLGVQSFVDAEAASVGRQHKRTTVIDDIARLGAAGIENINVDLIAGLPHQTAESWEFSLDETVASGVPHVSVYMLEVDNDSRLGRELMAGGARYHAHFVPDEDLTANLYERACERLTAAKVRQYEISNFAREGQESRHNLKYWTRRPYLGFGVDAHSMLHCCENATEAVRFSSPDSLEEYVAGVGPKKTPVSSAAALEETFFLGLRLARGVDMEKVAAEFGEPAVQSLEGAISECMDLGLLARQDNWIRLTSRGRLLSNEAFQRFIQVQIPCGADTPVHRL
ncbi:MAG TPA: radical SAM family heme chaperone HemW [Terriglobales bacterium]|jgi:oxygen-independent coproporphyrinogen-3 oxidase|nr:radical SAM family heme chaperone HemW [Terriglobales bacterium]